MTDLYVATNLPVSVIKVSYTVMTSGVGVCVCTGGSHTQCPSIITVAGV